MSIVGSGSFERDLGRVEGIALVIAALCGRGDAMAAADIMRDHGLALQDLRLAVDFSQIRKAFEAEGVKL